MAYQKFTVESLGILDGGRIKEAIEQAIKRAELDCKDRPLVKEARTVSLQIHFQPKVDEGGDLGIIDVSFDVVEKAPKRKSRIYEMATKRGGLFFNEMSPEDVAQTTLDDAPRPKGVSNASWCTTA